MNFHEQRERREFIRELHGRWYTQVIEKQIESLDQGQTEVNMFIAHRHNYSASGKVMHVSLFPPKGTQGIQNRWDLFLPHYVRVFLKLAEKVPQSTKFNIYIGSSEGAILGLVFFRETMDLIMRMTGKELYINLHNIALHHIVRGSYEELILPSALSNERLENISRLYLSKQRIRQCKWTKSNGERCGNRQKHAFCWRHN